MKQRKYSNTYIRDNKNRKRNNAAIMDEKIKRMAESKINHASRYGKHPELIIKGQEDRINGVSYKLYDDESMRLSYSYGYYEKASRTLEGAFSKKIISEEEQKNIGMMDVVNEIPEQYINSLKQYSVYLEGRIYQLGKNAYDFTLSNGIDFEDYVNIMSIIQSEVNHPMFRQGYAARELELKSIRRN